MLAHRIFIILYYQETQGVILCNMRYPEENVSWTLEQVFYSGPVRHSEDDVYFSVCFRFAESNYWFHKWIFLGKCSKQGAIINWTYWRFEDIWRKIWCCYRKSVHGQAKAAHFWYEKNRDSLLDHEYLVINVYTWLFRSKFMICVLYLDYCLCWESSQYDIDKVVNYLKADRHS